MPPLTDPIDGVLAVRHGDTSDGVDLLARHATVPAPARGSQRDPRPTSATPPSGTGTRMSPVTIYGLCAVAFMMAMYALERRGRIYIVGFALGCLAASAYGFLSGAWPFGVAEIVWSAIALLRLRRPATPPNSCGSVGASVVPRVRSTGVTPAPASPWTLDRARVLDAEDPIGGARRAFSMPPGVVYLNANSLGPLAAAVPARVRRTVEEEWGATLSKGWTEHAWMEWPLRIGDRIAPVIGAMPGEVLVADTTSIALTKVLGAALRARPTRRVVLSSTDNFPSDLYVAMGAARASGAQLEVVDRTELEEALDDRVAVCCLTQVDFRTGALHDLPRITAAAHRVGALVVWDLCHSAGAVPVGCDAHDVDLAVGCTYKYLNGGPGSPSFLYVRRRLQRELENPLPGWLGHADPFGFALDWEPAEGIGRFLTSSPPVIALAALDAALDVFDGVSIDTIRKKSKALGELFVGVVADAGVPSIELASPASAGDRGAQVSLRHPRAAELLAGAADRGVVGDFRPPSLCRFGMSPLALSFEDVWHAAETVADVARSLG